MSKKPQLAERGPFRSIAEVLIDGPDYQALSPEAKLVFFHVKLSLGASGITTYYPVILPQQTGLSLPVVESCLEELRRGGWIRWERNVYWLVDGLRHDPHLSPRNLNHREAVEKHLKGLPNLSILDDFRRFYRHWFEGKDVDPEPLKDTTGYAIPPTMGAASGITETESESESEKDLTASCAEAHHGGVLPITSAPSARAKKEPETEQAHTPTFADFKAAYPKRAGSHHWKEAEKRFAAIVKKGEATAAQLVSAATGYRLQQKELGKEGTSYVAMASNFLGTSGAYLEHIAGTEEGKEIAPEVAATWDNVIWGEG